MSVNEQWMHDAEVRMEARVESFGAGMEAGALEERAHWHRTPGTYRTDDATEVVVDLPESLSWLEDEFPDEVNAIVAAERERIKAEVKALPTLVLPTGTYVDVEDVFDAVTEP